MGHWWNKTDVGKARYWQKNFSHCCLVYHKCHRDWLDIGYGPPN